MALLELSVVQFKNYAESRFQFDSGINCIVGDNGSGKTNLLDAIYYLAMTKSAFQAVDQQNIRQSDDFFRLEGVFEHEAQPFKIYCALQTGQKKIFKVENKPVERLSEHIGRVPLVLVKPDDSYQLNEGSEQRRAFFDHVMSQISQPYLNSLLRYNHALKQRNQLLKQFAEKHWVDHDLLTVYDQVLLTEGHSIAQARSEFMQTFEPVFVQFYRNIADKQEPISLTYASHFADPEFATAFKAARPKDLAMARTTQGIHKDDFGFALQGLPLKKFGSQGQQKSFAIALKLAQFEVLRQAKGEKPLLLLDDIFDKLDDKRIAKLMEMMASGTFGQVWMTDARPERSHKLLKKVTASKRFFYIRQGACEQVEQG
ncbi:MAG TPA: DNA replication and repair protein RecF [Microscillaceae bacterium]|jgi:DNA replication and repair protein RecF|nr:DNA replication and repair protein RecF [Microscillaceae bacterium]